MCNHFTFLFGSGDSDDGVEDGEDFGDNEVDYGEFER